MFAFSEALRSLIIAVKSIAKQLSKGKQGGVKVRGMERKLEWDGGEMGQVELRMKVRSTKMDGGDKNENRTPTIQTDKKRENCVQSLFWV